MIYDKEHTREISFPVGGIGTGCVGISGNGRLIDMEIFNAPNKGSHAAFSHFAIKAERDGVLLDRRIVNGDYDQSLTGQFNRPDFNCYGFGPDRATMAGFPHFEDCTFDGAFPFATLRFADRHFPGKLTMTAFNPFIPTNDKDSSIPAAFFEFEIKNTTDDTLTYALAYSQANLYTSTDGIHSLCEKGPVKALLMDNPGCCEAGGCCSTTGRKKGNLTIATDAEDTSAQLYWYRGKWFDNIATFWQDFGCTGHIKNRSYARVDKPGDVNFSVHDVATLVAHVEVKPKETAKLRFVLTWHSPSVNGKWKSYYETIYKSSLDSAIYAVENFKRLLAETRLFADTLHRSSMPLEAIDAVTANLAVIKSPTCIRLEDGSLYGYEGCHCGGGCCEGSCTHVWSYTYSIPFLFPKLERSMRSLEFTHSMTPEGGMGFRIQLPVGSSIWYFRPCVDGQYGTVMRVLREYRISGDMAWLSSIWEQVKKSIEYAWSDKNPDKWDPERRGIISGRAHHTLDMELFGENAWLTGMYLGGLKAGEILANELGDTETAQLYAEIFARGKGYMNEHLFNGEYFYQRVDVKDKSVLEQYAGDGLQGEDILNAYWNDEQQQIMYQIGEGCGIDQVLGGWHANLIGIGEIFDKEKERKALSSIYKYNYIKSFREHVNPCRLFGLNDEGGLIICAYPDGKERPFIPVPYAEEAMNGFEYQAAIHMIQSGMVDEGMECIRALRKRYDGAYRNPWNEFECGNNYARSMASYALLLTYSGFSYNMARYEIGFKPIGYSPKDTEPKRFFWSVEGGFGEVVFEQGSARISVLYGNVDIRRLGLPDADQISRVVTDGADAAFKISDGVLELDGNIENKGWKNCEIYWR